MLLKITDPVQLSASLAGYTWPQGADVARLKPALTIRLRYVEGSNLVEATVSLKQKLLGDMLRLLPVSVDCWKSFAATLLVSLTEALCVDELDPLYSVTDRPSMARVLTRIIAETTKHSTLKAVKTQFQRLTNPQQQPDWATQMLTQFLDPGHPGAGQPVGKGGALAASRIGVSESKTTSRFLGQPLLLRTSTTTPLFYRNPIL